MIRDEWRGFGVLDSDAQARGRETIMRVTHALAVSGLALGAGLFNAPSASAD